MSKINVAPDITGIPHAKNESILESLETSGCVVNTNAAKGCAAAAALQADLVKSAIHKLPLAALETGEILPCICTAKTDVTLELPLLTVTKNVLNF